MLGVMIHGAIRNVTVSVKMGVRGIPWVGREVSLGGCEWLSGRALVGVAEATKENNM